uniref:Uncharacterized protein n=1 Tax=Eutreptiella gymnastica TaxID=73025 RepID=A0A7S4C8G8_9EUGL
MPRVLWPPERTPVLRAPLLSRLIQRYDIVIQCDDIIIQRKDSFIQYPATRTFSTVLKPKIFYKHPGTMTYSNAMPPQQIPTPCPHNAFQHPGTTAYSNRLPAHHVPTPWRRIRSLQNAASG